MVHEGVRARIASSDRAWRTRRGCPSTWCARRCPDTGSPAKPPEELRLWVSENISRGQWETLLAGLGYDRYGAQGGVLSARRSPSASADRPRHCISIHTNVSTRTCRWRSGRPDRVGAVRACRAGPVPQVGLGLRETAVDTAADPGFGLRRLSGCADDLDRRAQFCVLDRLRRSYGDVLSRDRVARAA